MKRCLSRYSVEQDKLAAAEICDHLEDVAGRRGEYYPRDMQSISLPLGAKVGNMSERLARRSEWTIGEVLALEDAGLLPGSLRSRILASLGASASAEAPAYGREVSLEYSRARNAIVVKDGKQEIGVARFHTRLSDATTKLVRGVCKAAGERK